MAHALSVSMDSPPVFEGILNEQLPLLAYLYHDERHVVVQRSPPLQRSEALIM